MPRIPQGPAIRGSQEWIQKLVNEKPDLIDSLIKIQLQLAETEEITWYSPLAEDEYAEYQDQAFLDLLDIKLPNATYPFPISGLRNGALSDQFNPFIFLT